LKSPVKGGFVLVSQAHGQIEDSDFRGAQEVVSGFHAKDLDVISEADSHLPAKAAGDVVGSDAALLLHGLDIEAGIEEVLVNTGEHFAQFAWQILLYRLSRLQKLSKATVDLALLFDEIQHEMPHTALMLPCVLKDNDPALADR